MSAIRNVARFGAMKKNSEKIAMLTAYDAPQARAQAGADVDILLVGDSVGTNILGYLSEREVTLADMAHHMAAVRRGAPNSFIICDLPFATYDTPEQALASSKILQDAGADAVKFEGPRPDLVRVLINAGIPVCGHLGLEPQHHERKAVQGKTAEDARRILADARALDEAGVFMLVLEMVPEELGEAVTKAVKAATIGIGAGRRMDGQVLVYSDVLGYQAKNFRHNRRYAEIGEAMRAAAEAYVKDVHESAFPAQENASFMPKEALDAFNAETFART